MFVHGCFWHQHDCPRGTRPATNAPFWERKLSRNVERDAFAIANLEAMDWSPLVIWECEIRNREELAKRMLRFFNEQICTK
ncbi:Fis family transcriptional regulator [Mesorhizobium sp. L2C054A000]|nr:Fis family transcriptional regulator [Mesorhizobium sp. L2C054A000]